MFRRLQDSPHLLEIAYQAANQMVSTFSSLLRPDSWGESVFIPVEKMSKGAIFDCRMCGQCVLHHTGMTCPMTCPKNLRNGPCGGVLLNGNCEILPDKPCIWVQAWDRSKHMRNYGNDIQQIQAPLNHQLRGTSAWINDQHRQAELTPNGWEN